MMKLFFLNNDSLYKIFTTLEKTPKNSHIQIFIESSNQFFHNPRRSTQIDTILRKRNIKATFIAQNEHQKIFFEEHKINHEVKKENKIRLLLNLVYWFFFNIKKFHIHTYDSKNYTFFAIFWAEILLLLMAGYGIYSLILPKTTITITPAYEMNEVVYNFRYLYPEDLANYPYTGKHILIPIYTGTLNNITSSLTLDKQLRPDGSMTKGTIRIINTTKSPISLKIHSQLIDDLGIEYTTNDKVTIPASQWKDKAGIAYVSITSKNTPENNLLVQEKGESITLGHRFLIKNLRQSRYTKQIYAEASDGFDMKTYKQPWFILQSEIGELQKQLYNSLYEKRKEYLTSEILPKGWILLPFDEFITMHNCQYDAMGDTWAIEELKLMSWTLHCDLTFNYVQKEDVINGMKEYIEKRSSNTRKVVSIQNNFMNFFDLRTGANHTYIIPTKVNIIEAYNLQTDTNNVLGSLKAQLAGKSKQEAQQLLQTIPEIEKWEINISPFWYSAITTVKSRIHLKINDSHTTTE